MAEHAETGNQGQTGHGIEHRPLYVVARIVCAKIFGIVGYEGCHTFVDDPAEILDRFGIGRRQYQRAGFDPDRQVRCRYTP